MRKFIFTLIAFALVTVSFAQENKKMADKKNSPWKQGASVSIIGGQGGSRNWPSGADKFSLSFAGYLNLWANRTWRKNTWENSLDLGYAFINTSSVGVRKQDDKVDLYIKYGYQLNSKWKAGVAGNLRTQMTNGFDYSYNKPRRNSGFFAPAFLVFAPGFNYKPWNTFEIFISPVAARWVIATNKPYSFNYQGGIKPDGTPETPLASYYGVDPVRKVRFEAGPYFSFKYKGNLFKNVMYKSRLDAFSDFGHEEPGNIDWYWTNTIGMKVNRLLQVTYNFDVVYDDNTRMFGPLQNKPGAQLRSMLGVGLMVKF